MKNVSNHPIERTFVASDGSKCKYEFYEPTMAHQRIANQIIVQFGLDSKDDMQALEALAMACICSIDGEKITNPPAAVQYQAGGKSYKDLLPMFVDFARWTNESDKARGN